MAEHSTHRVSQTTSWHQMCCVLGRCVVLFLVCRFSFRACVYSCRSCLGPIYIIVMELNTSVLRLIVFVVNAQVKA